MKRKLVVVIIAILLLIGVTGPKLFRMCQIRGWIPGATIINKTIADKWIQHYEGKDIYWISWGMKV